MNSYLNDRLAIDRLKREYNEHKNLVIAFDFDNTIFDYHNKGLDLQPVIKLLQRCAKLGFTMCLHTATCEETNSNHEKELERKKGYCEYGLGVKVSYVNESPLNPRHFDYTKIDKYKPFYSILLDDRAGLSASYNILKTTLDELKL